MLTDVASEIAALPFAPTGAALPFPPNSCLDAWELLTAWKGTQAYIHTYIHMNIRAALLVDGEVAAASLSSCYDATIYLPSTPGMLSHHEGMTYL